MIYWNNIYWKITSSNSENLSNNTSLNTSDEKLDLVYIPLIYPDEGFCIKGSYSGNIVIKIGDEIIELSSEKLEKFKIEYQDNILSVNNEKKNITFTDSFYASIKVNIDKNSKVMDWCICPKKHKTYPTCFIQK